MGTRENGLEAEQQRSSRSPVNGRPQLPLDQGWAWCVMFGAFINVSLILIFIRSMAILFIQFLEKYQESATMTTLAFGFCSVMFAISNLLGPTYLLHHFEVRTLAVTGAIINFLGILSIAFAPNIIVIDVMMACIGISHGLISVPQTTLVGRYFKKRLSFATAFVNLGISVGTIAGPPLTQSLLDIYGLQGTVMLLAGINMNCIVGSMLLRPDSLYAPPDSDASPEEDNETANKEDNKELINSSIKVYSSKDITLEDEVTGLTIKTSDSITARARTVSESGCNDETLEASNDLDNQEACRSSDVARKKYYRRQSSISDVIDAVSTSSSIRYLNDVHIFLEPGISKGKKRDTNRSKNDLHENVPLQDEESEPSVQTTWFTKFRKSVSKSIYTHPLGILLVLASGLGVHAASCIAYMPSAGKENGLSDDQIPYLLTIVGICDLISKLCIGLFADMGYIRRIHIACFAGLFAGTLLQFLRFFRSFGLMILFQVLIGLTGGVMHALVAVIAVDILGLKHMGHIVAGYFLVNGFVLFFDHFVIGFLKDSTNSFMTGYNYIGGIILLSAFLLLLEPCVAKLKPVPKP